MPKRALIERRPWLLASLIAGISYYFMAGYQVPGLYQIAWKGAGVALLAVWALRRHRSSDARQIGVVMALGALGDMAIEANLIAGQGPFCSATCSRSGSTCATRAPRLASASAWPPPRG